MDVTGEASKVQCCKEQYCIWTRNVRSTNQGKLEVVKQEMAGVNLDILGISELKWTGKGDLTQLIIISVPDIELYQKDFTTQIITMV